LCPASAAVDPSGMQSMQSMQSMEATIDHSSKLPAIFIVCAE
jgi:hypothetical protein